MKEGTLKKEGFKRSLAGSKIPPGLILNAEIEKREKKKNLKKFLEVQKRFLPLQSQRKRREKQKR